MMDVARSRRRSNWLVLLIIGGVLLACCQIAWLNEKSDCVCSVLSHEWERHELDDRVRSICDCNQTGTFLLVHTTCEHGNQIQLKVFPDEGYYIGLRLEGK